MSHRFARLTVHDRLVHRARPKLTQPGQRAIEHMPAASEYTGLVRRLGCLRGVSTLTGLGLAVETGVRGLLKVRLTLDLVPRKPCPKRLASPR